MKPGETPGKAGAGDCLPPRLYHRRAEKAFVLAEIPDGK